ncbi:MAG TPA: tagaturonate epimerase family protein, partial [bacterium]|nr:tagaturonate epimerase family protein [bacterium]
DALQEQFTGEQISETSLAGYSAVKLCELTHENAEALRSVFDFTNPVLVGVQNSYGLGDRLGLANPGHLRAIQELPLKPVLAQQSIRELERTHRTPDEVMDTASWAVFQEGYTAGFGADADHLKTTEDIDYTIKAGFTMFTFDPGDYVVNEADSLPAGELEARAKDNPWDELDDTLDECLQRYAEKRVEISPDFAIEPTRGDVLRGIIKYGAVIAHAVRLYQYLSDTYPDHPREVELSVDETESVTQPFEHYLVANELKRRGVELVSLAPRFVGDFEKGIDYKGDLNLFKQEYIKHLKIAEKLGPYKISIHSGSDKFSVYNVIGSLDRGFVHVKTAGTSYLEALRTIATVNPQLFREILDYSRELYPTEKRTYHVSADLDQVPSGDEISDEDLVVLFESPQVHARQVLHVTFGRVLTDKDDQGNYRFRDDILRTLREHEETHYRYLQNHFQRHFDPFL